MSSIRTIWPVLVVLCLCWAIPGCEAEVPHNNSFEWPFGLPIAQPLRNLKKGWNETCMISANDTLNIDDFVTRCKHKGRLLSSEYKDGKCITMDMSLFNETQFNKVFRHAVEILGITMVFNNTNHVFLKMENLRWWHKKDEVNCPKRKPNLSLNEENSCLHDRFYHSYGNCDHVMVIENNPLLEHILIYRHTLDNSASHPRNKEDLIHEDKQSEEDYQPIVIRNNPKLDQTFFQKTAKLFQVRKLSEHYREFLTCFPSVPLKRLSELKDCRYIAHSDLIIDGSTDMDIKTVHLKPIKWIDGCIQIKNTQWKSHQVAFINEGTIEGIESKICKNATFGTTELSGNKDLCVTYPLWYVFQKNVTGNKDGAECEVPVEKNCQGREIRTTSDLLRLERCTEITGSLTLKGLTIQFPRHVKAMNDIERIERRLTIVNCTVSHIMLASLKSVGANLEGLKIRIKNVKGLKTVNMPSLWIGVNRGKDVEISGCRGYRRPIHLGGTFDGKKYVGREVVPLDMPKFQPKYSSDEYFWYTTWIGIPMSIAIVGTYHARRVYRHW